MGSYKARSYYRARRTTLGRRIGATQYSIVPRGLSASQSGYDVSSAASVVPRQPLGAKYLSVSFAAPISASGSGTTGITTGISSGTLEDQRIGSEITLHHIDVCYNIEPNTNSTNTSTFFNGVRFMLCLDRVTDGTAPGLDGFKQNGSDTLRSPWDTAYVPTMLVPLMDTLHCFDSSRRNVFVRKRIYLKGIKTTWNSPSGLVSSSVSNHLFFLFRSQYDSTTGSFINQMQGQVNFTLCYTE